MRKAADVVEESGTALTVGVIGLGDLGDGVVRSALREGMRVVAFDLRAAVVEAAVAAGAEAAESVRDLVERSTVISIVVVSDAQVRAVVEDVLAVAKPGTHVVVHSTVLPQTIVEVAQRADEHGVVLFDAAVTGGGEKARRGLLTVMVGCEEASAGPARPLLDAIGKDVFYVGRPGAGTAAKLVNNLLSLSSYALQLEAMQLGAAYGLDEDTVTTIVSTGQGDSRGIRTWGRVDRLRRAGTWASKHEMMTKDLSEAVFAAAAHGIVLPMTATAASTLPHKIATRDLELDARPDAVVVPRCTFCDQELAAPFRGVGTHPECR